MELSLDAKAYFSLILRIPKLENNTGLNSTGKRGLQLVRPKHFNLFTCQVLTEEGADGTGRLSSLITRSSRFSSVDLVSIMKEVRLSSILLTVCKRNQKVINYYRKSSFKVAGDGLQPLRFD